MINTLINILIGGICLGAFCILPVLPFILPYMDERKKNPEAYKKIEDDFVKFIKTF